LGAGSWQPKCLALRASQKSKVKSTTGEAFGDCPCPNRRFGGDNISKALPLPRVCGKKLFLGTGCGVWGVGFERFSGGQLPNFQGKSPGIFPPIPAMGYFLRGKKSKSLIQQGF